MNLYDVQARLAALGLYHRAIDGNYGPRTDDAIEALFLSERVTGFEGWGDKRREIAAGQVICRMAGINPGVIDGLAGTMTRHAFEFYDARQANGGKPVEAVENWRDTADKLPAALPSHPLPPSNVIAPKWPRQSQVPSFFGAPGSNQVSLTLPFPMRLAWDTAQVVRKWSCHQKCREHFETIWVRTLDHYGLDEIKRLRLDLFGGCLNVRLMRGSTTQWSMHSWGIAEDVDPEHNELKMTRERATLDDAPYDPFWRFVYDEGAIGLGRERNYDWMHFQFARL